MNGDERAILTGAQDRAIATLAAVRLEANRIVGDAETDALTLLFEQHKRAEDLLRQQREEAAVREFVEGEADELLERHRGAADLLASGEQEVAEGLRATSAGKAVDVLMKGQREAAAILLDAWMKVTEGRPSAETRST